MTLFGAVTSLVSDASFGPKSPALICDLFGWWVGFQMRRWRVDTFTGNKNAWQDVKYIKSTPMMETDGIVKGWVSGELLLKEAITWFAVLAQALCFSA